MEATVEEAIDLSRMELLPTEGLQKIPSDLPVRVERGRCLLQTFNDVCIEEVWQHVQVLIIAPRMKKDSAENSNKPGRSVVMKDNKLYIDVDELEVIRSLVSAVGQHIKEFIFDPDDHDSEPVLSIITTYCHNIESIQVHRVDDSDIKVFSRLLYANKQLHSIACRNAANVIKILPLKDWKSLYFLGLYDIPEKQWERKLVELIKNSPSLEKFYVYDWKPSILTAISKCKEFKNLYYPIWNEIAANYLLQDTFLLNRLTHLKVQTRPHYTDLTINLLSHCVNLESLELKYSGGELPAVVLEAVLALPRLESLDLRLPDFSNEILSRLLKFKHLRLQDTLHSMRDDEIFEMIINSECLEKLEIPYIKWTTELFEKLAQNPRKFRKTLNIRVDSYFHEKVLKIGEGSRIHLITELDDQVRQKRKWILYD